MSTFELAQLNVADMRFPLEAPEMADFVAALERINGLAETSPGYLWRLETDDGDATALRPFGEDKLVNLSVWTDLRSLQQFVYRSAHADFVRRRAEWFAVMEEAHLVLWWVPEGHRPDLEEARERLEHLRTHGPGRRAFLFGKSFPPPVPEGGRG
jgi:hypothetical protein